MNNQNGILGNLGSLGVDVRVNVDQRSVLLISSGLFVSLLFALVLSGVILKSIK